MATVNPEVSQFLDQLQHPLRKEIDALRHCILNSGASLAENIKWNGPNYTANGEDRITMKIQPPKNIQVIFHRGAKKQTQPSSRLIADLSGLLAWKENDRAIVTFTGLAGIEERKKELSEIVKSWVEAARSEGKS